MLRCVTGGGALFLLLSLLMGCSDEPNGSDSPRNKKQATKIDGPGILEIDPKRGEAVYASTCVTCHGQHGQGMPNQGIQIRRSKFIAEKSDEELLEYMKVGRAADAPDSTSGILMPARGGNQALDDAQLRDVVAFLRVMQQEQQEEAD